MHNLTYNKTDSKIDNEPYDQIRTRMTVELKFNYIYEMETPTFSIWIILCNRIHSIAEFYEMQRIQLDFISLPSLF